jgi:hypothetical protein
VNDLGALAELEVAEEVFEVVLWGTLIAFQAQEFADAFVMFHRMDVISL